MVEVLFCPGKINTGKRKAGLAKKFIKAPMLINNIGEFQTEVVSTQKHPRLCTQEQTLTTKRMFLACFVGLGLGFEPRELHMLDTRPLVSPALFDVLNFGTGFH